MMYVQLFCQFFKTGLFAIGGGLATLPFLREIGEATGWYTAAQLADMLAVSESTPGPIGINMATYVGYTVGGLPGAVIATIGEVTPSIVVILIIATLLKNFRDNPLLDRAFYGLRPASTGLIASAGVLVVAESLLRIPAFLAGGGLAVLVNWPALALAAVVLVATNWVKWVKELHPIVFIAFSAAVGVLFRFGGA